MKALLQWICLLIISSASCGCLTTAFLVDRLLTLPERPPSEVAADVDFFPNNDLLVVYGTRRQRNLFRYSLADAQWTQLTTGKNKGFDAAISPDGSKVVFSRLEGHSSNLFLLSSESGEVIQLTDEKGYHTGASFSPDGSRIVFSKEHRGEVTTNVLDLRSGVSKKISSGDWDDGRSVIYVSIGINHRLLSHTYVLMRYDLDKGVEFRIEDRYTVEIRSFDFADSSDGVLVNLDDYIETTFYWFDSVIASPDASLICCVIYPRYLGEYPRYLGEPPFARPLLPEILLIDAHSGVVRRIPRPLESPATPES